ncbi:peptidyl-prolyl cis-trans isomerase [candidate division KSB1 bacterium]|nr:peptidyl-prolyl cis-trans isomerase [candidate division KSB1 bacterium]
MKRSSRLQLLVLGGIIFTLIFQAQLLAQKTIYLKAEKENLRLSPQGTIIGQIQRSTELLELERQGKWVKVALTAWVWAAATTEVKDEALGPKFRASLIMVEYQTDAQDILTKLKAGQSFEELAKAKSVHPTAQNGGDLGFFQKGDFDAKFESAIFNVQPNQISGIIELKVETKTYFCIFKRIQ